jgi:hypothetical protein
MKEISQMEKGKISVMNLCIYLQGVNQIPEAPGLIPINISEILQNNCAIYPKLGKRLLDTLYLDRRGY